MAKFDMEEAARLACEKFDKEHSNDNEEIFDEDGFATCDCGCGAKTHRDVLEKRRDELTDSLVGSEIIAKIEIDPSNGKAGVTVSLPNTREQAYLLMLGIINTMSLAGSESFDEIIDEVSRLNSAGAMSKGEKYVP